MQRISTIAGSGGESGGTVDILYEMWVLDMVLLIYNK
jgi:hypothetical protein